MTTTARDTYLGGMTSTASPARLLIMLYDRLVLDLQRAVELGDLGEFLGAGRQLMHAQEIVLELQGSLRDRRLGRRRAAVRRSTPGCTRRWCGPTCSATSPRPGPASPSSSRSPTPGARRRWPPSSPDLADRPR